MARALKQQSRRAGFRPAAKPSAEAAPRRKRSSAELLHEVWDGADAYEDDRLGRLAVTTEGLAVRDERVRDHMRAQGVPLVGLLAGGYGRHIEDTVGINLATVQAFAA